MHNQFFSFSSTDSREGVTVYVYIYTVSFISALGVCMYGVGLANSTYPLCFLACIKKEMREVLPGPTKQSEIIQDRALK